jgi:hypothetical protein
MHNILNFINFYFVYNNFLINLISYYILNNLYNVLLHLIYHIIYLSIHYFLHNSIQLTIILLYILNMNDLILMLSLTIFQQFAFIYLKLTSTNIPLFYDLDSYLTQ